jgi:cytochrome c biogenesis protein CcmG/thiol:disulfide interchange protein DsbE
MTAHAQPDQTRRRLLLTVPFVGAVAAGAAFLALLEGMQNGTYDPRGVPNPRIGHIVPSFSLPAQPPYTSGFSSADIIAAGHPILVNFFASWCVPCLEEAPTLLELQQKGLQIWGIVYKDSTAAAQQFLDRNGNPFTRLARDETGTVAINWGVYGVPESYFIDRTGTIRWRWPGALDEGAALPQLRQLLAKYS